MSKIVFKKNESGTITIPSEFNKCILSEDDWVLAIDVAKAGKGKSTAIEIIRKNRPGNIVYGVLNDRLVEGVLVQYADGLKINFDNKTIEGLNLFCEDGDVAYTDLMQAIEETSKIPGTADDVASEAPTDLAGALSRFFKTVTDSMKKQQEEVANMTEEEREDAARKASVMMRRMKLAARKQQLLEMAAEIDIEIKILDKVLEQLDGHYPEDDDDEF
jgi:hypothetical protein